MEVWIRLSFFIFSIVAINCLVENFQVSKVRLPQTSKLWTSVFHPTRRSNDAIESLNEQAEIGDAASQAQLALFELLGIDDDPKINEAETKSITLAAAGVTSASTILGFLLMHNLTTSKVPLTVLTKSSDNDDDDSSDFTNIDDERDQKSQAIEHFKIAARFGDPIAQIMVGEHYNKLDQCHNSVDMYRKSAISVLSYVKDSAINHLKDGLYINPDDGPREDRPSMSALMFLEYAAARGEAGPALQAAAMLLSDELDLPYDLDKAIHYLNTAINGEETNAMILMAQLHMEGVAPEPDLGYARELLEKALDMGNEAANALYARFYLEGLGGTVRNIEIARKHLNKGVEVGHVDAMFLLGQLHATALKSSNPDSTTSLQYWSEPAKHGHVHASWYVAEFYMNLLTPSTDVISQNTALISRALCEAALPLYRSVAHSGRWRDLLHAAYSDFQKDRTNAAAVKFMFLSDMGYRSAHVNLARLLQTREQTIYKSKEITEKQEFRAWERAANYSMPLGYLEIGHHHYYGTGGLQSRNNEIAVKKYRTATILGNVEAAFNLGYLYEWGDGVKQNTVVAAGYYAKAANSTDDAWLPCTMALTRLHLYGILNKTFDIDLYNIDYGYHQLLLKSVVVSPEMLLGLLIVMLLYSRR